MAASKPNPYKQAAEKEMALLMILDGAPRPPDFPAAAFRDLAHKLRGAWRRSVASLRQAMFYLGLALFVGSGFVILHVVSGQGLPSPRFMLWGGIGAVSGIAAMIRTTTSYFQTKRRLASLEAMGLEYAWWEPRKS